MAQRRLILRRDEGVPLPNKMDQEIASAINRALFHQKAPAHIRIMNAKNNARGTITAITHQNATAAMALIYRDVIITAARTVDNGVIDVEENESWERFKIHTVPLVRYMGKATEGLQKMRDEIHAENEGVTVPVQVRWLASPHSIEERRQKGEISASSVVFVVKGSKVVRRLVKEGIKVAGVWYRVEPFTHSGPEGRGEHGCRWGHIESKCSGKPGCGYCSGPHRTSDHKCNVVGCTAKQGALCGHTQEKCPNCRGNHIAFSSRCTKKTEVTRAAREERRREPAGRTARAGGAATGTNRITLGQQAEALGGGARGQSEEEMADARVEEAGEEEEDVTMGESAMAMTTAMVTITATSIEPEVETGAPAVANV
jgi:hypothetical protein